jgi:membrane protein YdbS with pleckstrin-like domain
MATETDTRPDRVPEVSGLTLLDGETIHHDLRPSWSNWSTSLTIYSLLTIVSVGMLAPLFIHPWLARRQSRYIVTSERVIKKTGLIGSSTEEYRIDDIRQLQTGSGWLESLLGKGNISFSTGAGGTQITFGGVPDYKSVANSIRAEQQ